MRYLTILLAVVMTACVCGTALASPYDPPGTTASTASSGSGLPPRDFRNPDNRVADRRPAQASASSDAAAVESNASIASDLSSGGGLSTFAIVLISVGGAVAIGGAAFAATRVVHHHPHTPA